jgi:hypothetical protein
MLDCTGAIYAALEVSLCLTSISKERRKVCVTQSYDLAEFRAAVNPGVLFFGGGGVP